jgi:hypothetical protein
MQIHNQTPTLTCEGALSDLVLQAARKAIPTDVDKLITLQDCGQLNRPLMPLLVGLIDAAKTTADAIADNAWDSGRPMPKELAAGLIGDLRIAMQSIQQATEAY